MWIHAVIHGQTGEARREESKDHSGYFLSRRTQRKKSLPPKG